jgi:hypothetical protein
MSSDNSLSKDLMDDAVKYQKVKTSITSIFGIVLSIVLILGGVYIKFIRKNKPDTYATITNVTSCEEVKSSSNGETKITFTCNLDIKYKVGEKEYSNKLIVSGLNKTYTVNDSIQINYDEENPNNISVYSNMNILAYILMGVGLFMFFGVCLNLYLVHKYKSYALIQTAGDLSSAVLPSSRTSSITHTPSIQDSIINSTISRLIK